ncbi:(S)-2-hydroxy-acid oxidase GLO1 [Folsomia candida]|uniref:(S)-2-hydroxy-acid oxidase GLO1 n=1 Tax=Folsomia candida TaxID=158441 RepID=UPI000B9088D1|nr:(S)-2-hydroxy-acid oxidase GLO1 [Folsomia candida]
MNCAYRNVLIFVLVFVPGIIIGGMFVAIWPFSDYGKVNYNRPQDLPEPYTTEELLNIEDFYTAAKSKLVKNSAGVWEYFEGKADLGWTLDQNKRAYRRYVIRPRILRDVSIRNLTTSILGKLTSLPIGVAPTSMQKVFHPDGEIAVATGAGRAGAIYILSTLATTSIEEVAASAPQTRLWFQLYFKNDTTFNANLLTRAENSGYEAVVLTLDAQIIGKRVDQLRHGFELPENASLANFDSNMNQNSTDSGTILNQTLKVLRDDITMTWDVVKWIRDHTEMKLILKGILTGEDAKLAADYGVDAIIVSNHGGRQLDSVIPTIDALSEVVSATASSGMEIYLDGGISLGTDVFKAIALGAKMVFVGRAALAGLSVAGEEGVTKVLEILKSELDLTMALSGVSNVASINSDYVELYEPI